MNQETKDGKRLVWAVQGFDGGLVTNYPKHALRGDQSPDAENFDPSQRYMIKKRYGTSNFSGDKGAPTGTLIRGIYAFTFNNGTTRFLAKEGTAIHDIQAGDWATTLTGLTVADGDEMYACMLNNLIIVTNSGLDAPVTATDTGNFSALGGSPPTAIYNCVHRRKVWLANTSADPSSLYYSATDNQADWTTSNDAGSLSVSKGDGYVINGLESDGDVLYISKMAPGGYEGAIYALFGNIPSEYEIRRIAWFGAVSQRAMCRLSKFVAVATPRGVYGLSGIHLVHLSDAVDKTILDLTDAQRAKIACAGYKDQLHVAYPASGSTNTKTMVVDLKTSRWSRYAYGASNIVAGSYCVHPNGNLYGAATGTTIRVVRHDDSATQADIGSTAVAMYWKTPDVDFGKWFADKHDSDFALHTLTSQTTLTWTLTHDIDGVDSGDSVTFVPASASPVKKFWGQKSEKHGRFWQWKIAESSSSAAEAYGFQASVVEFPLTRQGA